MDQVTQDRIDDAVKSSDIMLFMKGTPVFPQCGFSAATVQILSYFGVKFQSANVLEDAEVRQGIKEYSDWPTIPQLYVKGEFVGAATSSAKWPKAASWTSSSATRGSRSTRRASLVRDTGDGKAGRCCDTGLSGCEGWMSRLARSAAHAYWI